MKPFLLIFVLSIAPCLSNSFYSSESNVSIQLPDDWKHDPEDKFGFCIDPPDSSKGVRIHLRSEDQKTLVQALNSLAKAFAFNPPPKDKIPQDRIIEIAEVKDSLGNPGLRVATGLLQQNESGFKLFPSCYHYLFINSKGRAVCVCLYTNPNIQDSHTADSLILSGLKVQ